MKSDTRFSKKSIEFLADAGKATSPLWLDKHKLEHKKHLIEPLSHLANYLYENMREQTFAKRYKFPMRGFGRLRRPKHKVKKGQPAYRNWVHLRATPPSISIFDQHPSFYFYLSSEEVFAGGGLYEAGSRQTKQIRQWLADDPSDLESLLKSKSFAKLFPRGLETEKILKTHPRAYPPDHKHIDWLRLQAYYVTQSFTKKQLYSEEFKDLVLENWQQCLRLNDVLSAHFVIERYNPMRRKENLPESMDEEIEAEPELWDERL